jgi:hypothetical protein
LVWAFGLRRFDGAFISRFAHRALTGDAAEKNKSGVKAPHCKLLPLDGLHHQRERAAGGAE